MAGITVKKHLSRAIALKQDNNQNIEFSYYTLLSKQREKLLQITSQIMVLEVTQKNVKLIFSVKTLVFAIAFYFKTVKVTLLHIYSYF
ncbi:hypothetical protein GCM10009111_24790 [Colwellia asteriadis]|uniref:Uncharacterized protein n=1 Tax=Colwellia asteriadis TaxID=517723 RepID=A0ABN1L8P6_9GAMM